MKINWQSIYQVTNNLSILSLTSLSTCQQATTQTRSQTSDHSPDHCPDSRPATQTTVQIADQAVQSPDNHCPDIDHTDVQTSSDHFQITHTPITSPIAQLARPQLKLSPQAGRH